MSAAGAAIARPHRWDVPFGEDMTDADVDRLMAFPEIASVRREAFPAHLPLEGILRNDARIINYRSGDIVCMNGDYGNSAFLILSGTVRAILPPGLPNDLLGREEPTKPSLLRSITQLWSNSRIPEVRDTARYQDVRERSREEADGRTHMFLQDLPGVFDRYRTEPLTKGQIFGELAALGRIPRAATVVADTDASLLEIRWQGLRELRRFDPGWKRLIDDNYRKNALHEVLGANPLFKGLTPEVRQLIAQQVKLRTYGSFDWHASYKDMRARGSLDDEPTIAAEGVVADGLYLVRAGFARVSIRHGSAQRTLAYLGAGDQFGLDEAYESWKTGKPVDRRSTLSGLGYVDVLRVPAEVLHEYVFPALQRPPAPALTSKRTIHDGAFAEWLVDERIVNGTQTMLIDLERCVRCDDCVTACAQTHGGNPRFVRHGHTFDHWMVANACMHCRDPVCMIGCPTGAIHRHDIEGVVVINDDTCIGCGTCANSCPYDNIRLVEISDRRGAQIADDRGVPLLKATKCDLCVEQPAGPACQRACPHDALRRVSASELVEHVTANAERRQS